MLRPWLTIVRADSSNQHNPVPQPTTHDQNGRLNDRFPLSLPLFPKPGDSPIAELPPLPKQQDQLQFGVWDAAVSGLYLWKHHWGSWSSGTLYQWKERGPHQPNPGKPDWILSRTLPWEPGNSIFLWGSGEKEKKVYHFEALLTWTSSEVV